MNKHDAEIKIGDFVKVSSHGERFWCEVTGIVDEKHLVVRINNVLLNPEHKFGDTLGISFDDIIDVYTDLGEINNER